MDLVATSCGRCEVEEALYVLRRERDKPAPPSAYRGRLECWRRLVSGGKSASPSGLSTPADRASARVVPVIGLVGGIGAGKSTVAAAFAARGGLVISGDALGHAALEVPEIRAQVLARWGERTALVRTDGRLDRRAIARIVFTEPEELRALEALVFPFITQRIEEELAQARSRCRQRSALRGAGPGRSDAGSFGWSGVCDHLVYVDALRGAPCCARLAVRSDWSRPT